MDGRTPPEMWLDALDAYSSGKIRNVHPKEENISVYCAYLIIAVLRMYVLIL
jgi:hypothetical protein